MSSWTFSGARWWRFDFHTHTPASRDFLEGSDQQVKDEVTPTLWLQKFMEKKIDCVAITDHNSGAWIDKLKEEQDELKRKKTRLVSPFTSVPRGRNFSQRWRAYPCRFRN